MRLDWNISRILIGELSGNDVTDTERGSKLLIQMVYARDDRARNWRDNWGIFNRVDS